MNGLSNQELIALIQHKLEENERIILAEKAMSNELHAVNEKLLQSEHLKSNFLSNIRNEINNPLSAILEFSKILSEGKLDMEAVKRYAALIYLEAFDLDFQLRNIFLSAEIEAGEAQLQVSKIQIVPFIQGIVKLFEQKIAKKQQSCSLIFDVPDDFFVFSDNEKLNLILSNLIANAITFNTEAGIIEIIVKAQEEDLLITVKDNGIGIAEEDRGKIFDRFFQVQNGSTKTYGGHGLGLSITKALAEILESKVSVYSLLGEGSEFTVILKSLEGMIEKTSYCSEGNEFLFDEQDEDDMLF